MRIENFRTFLCWTLVFSVGGSLAHAADPQEATCEVKSAVSFDLGQFYNNVLSRIDNSSQEAWLANFDAMTAAESEVVGLLKAKLPEEQLVALAKVVADLGYYLPLKKTSIDNKDKVDLGATLSAEAVALLTPEGQALWANRYESFAKNGKKNKYTAAELGINEANVEAVMKAQGKSEAAIATLRGDFNKVVVNLFQQPFEDMVKAGNAIVDEESRAVWNKKIYSSQLGAVARELILAEIDRLGIANTSDVVSHITESSDLDTHFRLGDRLTFYLWIYSGQSDGREGFEKSELVRTPYDQLPEGERLKDLNISRALRAVIVDQPQILDIFQVK